MNRLTWLLQRRGDAFALALGVALVAAAVVVHHMVVRPLAMQVEALQVQRQDRRERQVERLDAALARPVTAEAQIAGFLAHFAHDPPLSERLVRLHRIAAAHRLELPQAEYRLERRAESRLDRYQMVLLLSAPYPKLRAFVAAALREMPTTSLEAIRLQRPDIADGTAQAEITFTFFIPR